MSVPPDSTVPPFGDGVEPSSQERQWALLAHLSALAGLLFTSYWFGWGCFIGPLIIWLVKRDTMPFVNDQAKEALNFNITFALIGVALMLLTIITFGIGIFIALPLGVIAGIAWLVLVIVAALNANNGERYRYPFALRLVK